MAWTKSIRTNSAKLSRFFFFDQCIMNSDAWEYAKSSAPQGVDLHSPYQEKQWNYLNDINSGVYANSGLTQVQWDLSSLYNSGSFTATEDVFLVVPITMVAALTTIATGVSATVVPAAGVPSYSNLLTLKSNFQHLIHQIEIVANGKTVNDTQPFISLYENFKLLSSMSTNDLKQWGSSYGMGEELDSEKSVVWNNVVAVAAGAQGGVGLCNNRPYVNATTCGSEIQCVTGLGALVAGGDGQNAGCVNKSLQRRCTRVADSSTTAALGYNRVYGPTGSGTAGILMTAAHLDAEFKPRFSIQTLTAGGSGLVWYDYAVIPLRYICDVMDKMGLVRKMDIVIRAYFNTGALSINVVTPNTVTTQYGAIRQTTFAQTCPFTINLLNDTQANGGLPATATSIQAGCFIGSARTTSLDGGAAQINLGGGIGAHPMSACRAYYSLIKMEPAKALAYVEANREKQVVYENVIFNQYSGIPTTGTFSQLVQSGIKNPIGVCIIPLIGSSTLTSAGTIGFEQWTSPYDTCPSTYAPLSLTNLQVSLGGVQQLSQVLYYSFESFLEQVGIAETLTSTDFGIGVGLINQSWWEANRVYWVDLSRGRAADRASMRNLSISFQNNTNATLTLMVFTVYLDRITLDVETGAVKK